MKFIEVCVCAVLTSFMAGLFYATQYESTCETNNPNKQELHQLERPVLDKDRLTRPKNVVAKILRGEEYELQPCSRTNTMPCEVSPKDPIKDELDAQPQKEGLFRKGEKVTCIYNGVFWWDNGNEFTKKVGMQCEVVQVTKESPEFGPGYQHIKVNCLKGLEKMWSNQPGAGMVKNHEFNFVERWYSSDDCYHFSS